MKQNQNICYITNAPGLLFRPQACLHPLESTSTITILCHQHIKTPAHASDALASLGIHFHNYDLMSPIHQDTCPRLRRACFSWIPFHGSRDEIRPGINYGQTLVQTIYMLILNAPPISLG
eukprot:1155724-Pelagomonas_calceolata.AAC.2